MVNIVFYILSVIILIILLFFQTNITKTKYFKELSKPAFFEKVKFGDIYKINLDDFKLEVEKYPFEYHQSKTGVVGNLYNYDIDVDDEGNVSYKYPNTIHPYERYPPYHYTKFSTGGNVQKLLNDTTYYNYIRFLPKLSLLFEKYLNNKFPYLDDWEPVTCIISRKGTITNFHNDNGPRYQYTLYGKKKWIVVDKKYRFEMGFFSFHYNIPSRSIIFTKKVHEKDLDALGIPYKVIITKPDSFIYFPKGCLHYVESLSDYNVSINFAKKDSY